MLGWDNQTPQPQMYAICLQVGVSRMPTDPHLSGILVAFSTFVYMLL
jgi:hypothetical protein